MPLSRHELARGAHVAARCAGAAGKYWPYHDRLWANQPAFDEPQLIRYAEALGLDAPAFARCLKSGAYTAQIDEDLIQARRLGLRGTPAFLINGRRLVGAHPIETLRGVVEEILRDAQP